MSDRRLRELERRWAESADALWARRYVRELERLGAPDDRVLAERLRVGLLAPDRLSLAAALGHEPARRAAPAPPPRVASDLEEWVRDLGRWDPAAWPRAATAAAGRLLDVWDERMPAEVRPRRAVDAAAGWLACPCEPCAEAAHAAAQGAWALTDAHERSRDLELARRWGQAWPEQAASHMAEAIAGAAGSAAYACRAEPEVAPDWAAQAAAFAAIALGVSVAAPWLQTAGGRGAEVAVRAARDAGGPEVRAAVRAALLPWALEETAG